MQLLLIVVTFILAMILYRMLNSQRTTYPYVKVTRRFVDDNEQVITAEENEHGYITIDHDVAIIEGQEYALKVKSSDTPRARLIVENGALVSVNLSTLEGEKVYFIDPEYSIYKNSYVKKYSERQSLSLSL